MGSGPQRYPSRRAPRRRSYPRGAGLRRRLAACRQRATPGPGRPCREWSCPHLTRSVGDVARVALEGAMRLIDVLDTALEPCSNLGRVVETLASQVEHLACVRQMRDARPELEAKLSQSGKVTAPCNL